MSLPQASPETVLATVLRTNPEPFDYFTEQDVHAALTAAPLAYLQFVKESLADIATGRASLDLPAKQLFEDDEQSGDFRVMPCVVNRGEVVTKTLKLVGTNLAQSLVPDQITVGKAFALHPTENFVSQIFEACLLSSARTGLCAALAIDLLAESPRKLTVAGAGRVGYYTAFYASALASIEEIEFFDTDRERAKAAARDLAEILPGSVKVAASKAKNFSDADVVTLATTSAEPFCHPEETPAQLVISLGADTDNQSELHPLWAQQAEVFVDVMDSARYGDLQKWLAKGLLRREELTDFIHLLGGEAPAPSLRRRLFISTGSALFDNLTIAYLLSKSNG